MFIIPPIRCDVCNKQVPFAKSHYMPQVQQFRIEVHCHGQKDWCDLPFWVIQEGWVIKEGTAFRRNELNDPLPILDCEEFDVITEPKQLVFSTMEGKTTVINRKSLRDDDPVPMNDNEEEPDPSTPAPIKTQASNKFDRPVEDWVGHIKEAI